MNHALKKRALVVLVPQEFGKAVGSFLDDEDDDDEAEADDEVKAAPVADEENPFLADLLRREGFEAQSINIKDLSSVSDAILVVLVTRDTRDPKTGGPPCLVSGAHVARRTFPTAFICVWHSSATEDAPFRQVASGCGKQLILLNPCCCFPTAS